MNRKPIIIVQGANWGSEAKGMVAAALCERRNVQFAVRTGAVNAGHTAYLNGKKYVCQQIPTGWAGGTQQLVIGPGAYVNPTIFAAELNMLKDAGWDGIVYVDHRAGLHLSAHTDRASMSGRHYSIGATGKGCSEAILDRIRLRGDPRAMLFKDWCNQNHPPDRISNFMFADTVDLLNKAYDAGAQILLEGTQGTLLDLYLGPYPYTTHKQCTAAQWVVEAGLSPTLDYEVVLVARTYPIRVAGNSGPMPQEIDWPTLALEIDKKLNDARKPDLVRKSAIAAFITAKLGRPQSLYPDRNTWLSESDRDALLELPDHTVEELRKLFEFTTVTKKLRRVARLDLESLKYSVMVNRPSWIALTFLNYEFPEMWGETDRVNALFAKHVPEYLINIENATGVPVGAVTTGPESQHFHDSAHI